MIRLGFRHYKNLIVHKAWADFRAEAERTYLGVLWWILDPLINMVIFYLVFGVFLKMGTNDFIPFLLTGLVVWRFIEATVVRASNSLRPMRCNGCGSAQRVSPISSSWTMTTRKPMWRRS